MRRRDEARGARREQRLDVALDVEEVDRPLVGAPLQRLGGAVGQAAERAAAGARRRPPAARRRRAASRTNTLPSSNTRTRDALRARLTRSTSTRLPIRLERITELVSAIGLSDADRIRVAGELALPALVDEAEVDRLAASRARPSCGAARAGVRRDSLAHARPPERRAAARPARSRSRSAGSLPRSGLPRSAGRSASSAARPRSSSRRARPGEAEARHHALRTRPGVTGMPITLAARATRSVTARSFRQRDDLVVDRAAAGLAPPQISTMSASCARCARPSSPDRRRARSDGRRRSRSCSGASGRRPPRATRTRPRRRRCASRPTPPSRRRP